MIPRLVVASKNPDKITEIEEVIEPLGIAGEIVLGLDWPDVEETGATLEDNALLKAREVMAAVGLPAVADDTGLEVLALGGRPGVNTARFAGVDGELRGQRPPAARGNARGRLIAEPDSAPWSPWSFPMGPRSWPKVRSTE